jgi:hypothetical protein
MAEFQWWLLIVGVVLGGGLVWLVLADTSRRDEDVEREELLAEAALITDRLTARGQDADDRLVLAVLDEHRRYLDAPPPDEPDPDRQAPLRRPVARSAAMAISTPAAAPGAAPADVEPGHEAIGDAPSDAPEPAPPAGASESDAPEPAPPAGTGEPRPAPDVPPDDDDVERDPPG